AWRVGRGGVPLITARQRRRLAELVTFARRRSSHYRKRYAVLPPVVSHIHQLPVVTKPELMTHFDAWVTDPAVTRQDVDAFVADLRRVGDRLRGRYVVWTTSGTTGRPGVFLHD